MKNNKNIAVLVQDITIDYANDALNGISDFFKGQNVNLTICQTRLPNIPYGNFEYQYWANTQLIASDDVDVIIILTSSYTADIDVRSFSGLLNHLSNKKIISMGLPLDIPGSISTFSECTEAYNQVVSHLVNKHNCKHIAFMSANPTKSVEATDRFNAYLKALENNGLYLQPDLVFDAEFTYKSAMEILSRKIKSKENVNFDAILAANDNMAYACISYLTDLGLKIPDDVKVFGFDDLEMEKISSPTLSTVNQHVFEQGQKVAELALKISNGEKVPEVTRIPLDVFYRQSCGCVPLDDATNINYISEAGMPVYRNIQTSIMAAHFKSSHQIMNIYYLMDMIQTASSLDDLFNKFQKILSQSDVKALAICLYDNPIAIKDGNILKLPKRVHMALALDKETGIYEIDSNRTYNPRRQLLPEDIFEGIYGEYLIHPIFYGEKQFGYIICRMGQRNYVMYSIYAKVFSTAIAIASQYTKTVEDNDKLSKENQILMIKNSSLARINKTDDLTKILNKNAFLDLGQQTIDLNLEMGSRGCVFFGDMNNLKYINDTFGHEAGDKAIKAMAQVLTKSFRANDIIGRISGDEFAAVVPGLSMELFDTICQKISRNCKEIAMAKNLSFDISISLGAVEFNWSQKNIKKLIEMADDMQDIQKSEFHKNDRKFGH